MSKVPIGYYSMKILEEPNGKNKGALILSQVDCLVEKFPYIKDKFYLIERRGWRGLNESRHADIKLVEDLSYWDETLRKFPQSICLNIGPADFIDSDEFKPLEIEKIYDGIQVSHWTDFKRPEMLIETASLLPSRRFLKLGHFVEGGSDSEYELRDKCISLAERLGANIDFPYAKAKNNADFPDSKETMNHYINSAKIGILTTKVEGINRFKMECLSAGIPVLAPSDTSYPTKKHINKETGEFFKPTPKELAETIERMLSNLYRYNPREYILNNTGKPIALKKLKNALEALCVRDRIDSQFENIDWDGRNQSLIWGERVFETLRRYE